LARLGQGRGIKVRGRQVGFDMGRIFPEHPFELVRRIEGIASPLERQGQSVTGTEVVQGDSEGLLVVGE
jgi:hypothetical protein